jgi:hypothetical protein
MKEKLNIKKNKRIKFLKIKLEELKASKPSNPKLAASLSREYLKIRDELKKLKAWDSK